MGQINKTQMPTYVPDTQGVAGKAKVGDGASGTAAAAEANTPQDDFQLTKLSSVLTSLKNGASAMRNQVAQVMGAVRTGSYEVDALAVSRSIVGDSLAQR